MTRSATRKALSIQEILESILIEVGTAYKQVSDRPEHDSEPNKQDCPGSGATPYYHCSHIINEVPVRALFQLQRVSRTFMATIQHSIHLRRMMRIAPVNATEPTCGPLLVMHKVLGRASGYNSSQHGKLRFVDWEGKCASRAGLLYRNLPLNPLASLGGTWSNIRLSSSKREVTMYVIVDVGLWSDAHYTEQWHFASEATLGDFHAKWQSVGMRSIDEHRTISRAQGAK